MEEIRDELITVYMVALFVGFVVARQRDGHETSFKGSIEEAAYFGSYTIYALKLFITTMWADAWTYWKHYLLHHPAIYAIHKDHHVFHNPSTFAGYALHPVEAVWTFIPIMAFAIP